MQTNSEQNLREITQIIQWMPPKYLYSQIPINAFNLIFNYWNWLWRYFDSYMSPDKLDPITYNTNLNEEFKKDIKKGFYRYQALLNLLYVTEPLIRMKAEEKGESIANFKRLDFLEIFMKEECLYQITLLKQDYWESLNKKENEEIQREVNNFFKGKRTEAQIKIIKDRYENKHKEPVQNIDIYQIMPFTVFCSQIFREQRHLPEAQAWLKASNEGINFFKIGVANGDIKQVPGRGKDKQKRKTNFSLTDS